MHRDTETGKGLETGTAIQKQADGHTYNAIARSEYQSEEILYTV